MVINDMPEFKWIILKGENEKNQSTTLTKRTLKHQLSAKIYSKDIPKQVAVKFCINRQTE